MFVRLALALAVVALVAGVVPYAPPAQAAPLPQAASCAGVWVVVDFGALTGTQSGCATFYTTGTQALRSAAFTPSFDSGGLMAKINGLPTVPNTQQNYWSYWFATRQADGSYSTWTYYDQGPNGSTPSSGNAEGWRYESTSGGEVPPGAYPPKQVATTQPPAAPPPVTTTRTAPRTVATTVGAQVTTQPAATSTGSAADSATPSATPDPTGSPSSTPGASDSPSQEPVPAAAQASSSTGGLIGGVSSIAAIAAGAAGMLFWRRRQARVV